MVDGDERHPPPVAVAKRCKAASSSRRGAIGTQGKEDGEVAVQEVREHPLGSRPDLPELEVAGRLAGELACGDQALDVARDARRIFHPKTVLPPNE